MKLQQMKQGQFFITLPSSIVKAKGWIKGDQIFLEINSKGEIILDKKEINKV